MCKACGGLWLDPGEFTEIKAVRGKLQKTGGRARARILKSDFSEQQDVVTMDIRAAYDAPGLTALRRSFIYDRRGAGKRQPEPHPQTHPEPQAPCCRHDVSSSPEVALGVKGYACR